MTTEDQAFLEQAKQLDPAALKTLHNRFYVQVARYIQYKISDPDIAADLCGEVFVRVVEALNRGKAWRTSPQGWIMGIARNVVVDHYRQQAQMPEVSLDEQVLEDAFDLPHEQAVLNDQKRALSQALQELNTEQRQVILMRFILGIDINTVAEAIGKTPGAVKALQHRALKKLVNIIKVFGV